jgi:signal transduction histidine kinase
VVEAEVARSAIRITTRQLTFVHHRPEQEPLVRIHRGSMGRVFANLFRNSAQARIDATVDIGYEITGDDITCVVSDNGPGFTQDVVNGELLRPGQDPLEHLGLAIVVSTVEAHGGTVAGGNGPDGWAYIRIRLPVARGARRARKHASPGPRERPPRVTASVRIPAGAHRLGASTAFSS